ncbi:MAG: hypothetical protein L3J69_09560 [Desulfobacula sp.]|nr:hypothetical protein [Desulfobacula sp.]
MAGFMLQYFEKVKSQVPGTIIESRMDSAFFNQNIISLMAEKRLKFTASIPFARFAELKTMIEDCSSWQDIDNKKWVTPALLLN